MENSIVRIIIPETGECGTGYFLTKKTVATCFHVIESVVNHTDKTLAADSCIIKLHATYVDANEEKRLKVIEAKVGRLLDFDADNDIAILELENDIPLAEPVSLLRHNTSSVNADWRSKGYPAISDDSGIHLNGKIQSLVTFDINDKERIELSAEQVKDEPLGGISGSPVFVNGKVVGHITSNAVRKDGGEEKNIFGVIYAVSCGYIRRLAEKVIPELDNDLEMVVFQDGEIYIKRGIEGLISDNLLKGGVCLTGYLMSGKTRTIDYFKHFEKDGIFLGIDPQKIRSALVDFYNLQTKIENYDLESLLKFFCETIVRELNTTDESFSPPDLTEPGTKTGIASEWFTDELLSHFKKNQLRFFLYIDNAEVIFEKFDPQICIDFFSMLRGWTSEADSKGTAGILMSFTDAFFLKAAKRPAIFNAITSMDLKDFNAREIKVFARKYCLENKISDVHLTDEQAEQIIIWTSGNPCLVRLLFEGILQEKQHNKDDFDFDKAFDSAIQEKSNFKHYLSVLEDSLEEELLKEIELYDIDYAPIDKSLSNQSARRKLVKGGILMEQLSKKGKKSYKLRCVHFNLS